MSVVSKFVNELNICFDLLWINLYVLGFFFCGINEEFEVIWLESFKNVDLLLLKKIKFFVKWERCIILIEVFESNFKMWLWFEMEFKLLCVLILKLRFFVNVLWFIV